MIRQLAGAAGSRRRLVRRRDRAAPRPGPEGHARLRRRIARRPDARSDPRRPAGQRRLPGGDVRLAGRLRSREGRRRSRRRRTLGNVARRPDLDLLHPARPDLPQRRQAHGARRQVQPRAPDGAGLARRRRREHEAHHQEHRGGRRPDGEGATPTSPQIGLPASLSRAVAPEGAIMPKAYIEKVGEEEFRKKPIGSGPWKFVRNVPGDRIEFTAVANRIGAARRTSRTCTSCWCRRRARASPWCAPARRRSPRSGRRPC